MHACNWRLAYRETLSRGPDQSMFWKDAGVTRRFTEDVGHAWHPEEWGRTLVRVEGQKDSLIPGRMGLQ